MYGVSRITMQPNIMLVTFPAAEYSARSAAEHLEAFAQNGVVVDMICQSAPRGTRIDLSFTTSEDAFAAVMQVIPKLAPDKQQSPLWPQRISKSRSLLPAIWIFPCWSDLKMRMWRSRFCAQHSM